MAETIVPTASAQSGPITTNAYALDLSRGVVIGPGRVIGLAGAFTSLVDGIDYGVRVGEGVGVGTVDGHAIEDVAGLGVIRPVWPR